MIEPDAEAGHSENRSLRSSSALSLQDSSVVTDLTSRFPLRESVPKCDYILARPVIMRGFQLKFEFASVQGIDQ